MNTVKTAAVVLILLGVLYGVYAVLNRPETVGGDDQFPSIVGADIADPALAPGMVDPASLTPYDPTTVTAGAEAAMSPAIGGAMGGPPEMPATAFSGPGAYVPSAPLDSNPAAGPPPLGISSSAMPADGLPAAAMQPPPASGFDPSHQPSAYAVNPPQDAAAPPASDMASPDGTASPAGFSLTDDQSAGASQASAYAMPQDTAPFTTPSDNAGSRDEPAAVASAADFRANMTLARQSVDAGEFNKALETLSAHYYDTGLSPVQREELMLWLNLLSAKVIFSSEHHTPNSRRQVQPGETWESIAAGQQVPAMLLMNINGGAATPPAGGEIKVLQGPFHAEVNLTRKTVAVFLKRQFATEFAISNTPARGIQAGSYQVQSHQQWPVFQQPGAAPALAHSPQNPYGEWRLDLGGGVSLHSYVASADAASSIALPPQSARDLAAILSDNAKVEVRW